MAVLEYTQHYHAIRIRVKGSGNLKLTLYSLDDVKSQTLTPVAMSSSTNIAPTQLADFNQQRARLDIRTTEIDETFTINQINVYIKPIYSSYPQ